MKANKPELLAPAGGMEALKAAVAAGADAVYLGGRQFSARSSAANFDNEELREAVEHCHLRGVKVYVTANTVYYDAEISPLMDFVDYAHHIGVDAFLFQEIATALEAKRRFPSIELHASTQMAVQNGHAVEYLQGLGFSRVVLPRENSLKQITEIKRQSNAELEVFVHGALCVCYSGQCLMSSMIGGRSGNRGSCAQPCRKRYKLWIGKEQIEDGYLLSPKDMMTLDGLDEIISAGVDSLKIEGRMKSPEYVYQCVSSYRAALDGELRTEDDFNAHKRHLAQVFNRGGFTEGYFTQHSGRRMMATGSPKPIGTMIGEVVKHNSLKDICTIRVNADVVAGDGVEIWTNGTHPGAYIQRAAKAGEVVEAEVRGRIEAGNKVYRTFDKVLMDTLKRRAGEDTRKLKIYATCIAKVGEAASLTLRYGEITATAVGGVVQQAQKQPMNAEDIEKQLAKTGATPFVLHFEHNQIDNNLFISKGELNALRREAVDKLSAAIIAAQCPERLAEAPPVSAYTKIASHSPKLSALARNQQQLDGLLRAGTIARIYIECTNVEGLLEYVNACAAKCKAAGAELFAALPQIADSNTAEMIEAVQRSDADGILVRELGTLSMLVKMPDSKPIAIDYTLNVVNSGSYGFYRHHAETVCFSPEAGISAIKAATAGDGGGEIIVHGKPVVMTTRQCPIGLYCGEKDKGRFCRLREKGISGMLEDERGIKFPVLPDCSHCIAYIFNDRPVFMLNKLAALAESGAGLYRISLSDENADEAAAIALAYAGRQKFAEPESFTYGYFFKDISS